MIALLPFWRRKSKIDEEPPTVSTCSARETIRSRILEEEFEWFNRGVDRHFEDHSNDVLLLIFDKLSFNEKLVCRAVCRRFQKVLDKVVKLRFILHLRTYNRGKTVHFHLQRNDSDSIVDSSEFWPGLPNRTLANLNATFEIRSLYLAKQSCNQDVVELLKSRANRHLREVFWHNASCNLKSTISFLVILSSVSSLTHVYFQEDDLDVIDVFIEVLERNSWPKGITIEVVTTHQKIGGVLAEVKNITCDSYQRNNCSL
uniref:F-box domain-containing protein n=1 Tax=Steinernema glaseri TaxID=37863 RepID=A0A1I7Y5D2_9BILA